MNSTYIWAHVASKWRGVDVAIKVNNMIQDTKGFLAEAKLTL